MKPNENHWDDRRMAELFTAAGGQPAPPDEEFLDRLRETSTEAFVAEFSQPTQLPKRRSKMFLIATRGLAAVAAAAVVAGTCFWSTFAPDDSARAFGSVLDSVAKADTLHLEITRDGKAEQVWTAKPGQLRWNHADGTYRIARGGKLWLVDEKANRATSQPSSYFPEDAEGIDLLALLDVPLPKDRKMVLQQQPDEPTEDSDTVYRMEWPTAEGRIRIDALARGGAKRLHSLEATCIRTDSSQPIAKITVKAVDKPVDESLFVVGDTLTEDGRVGKVVDVQGIVSVKPVMHRRWTPVGRHMPVKPGDWLRTDVRGANATAFRLVKQTNVTLGPGSLAEVIRPNQIRLVHGVVKIDADPKAPVELLGPGDQKLAIKGRAVYRLHDEKLVQLSKDPLWLQGFESATAEESIGSLIAKVDGRDVPLTVGYHKVSVDIRDQIARTVIEESFVNHTNAQLEGVFYFPLPQDASISGFGMWINNELVEADVVEKQRAREIYETILRERRDPGLLEWSGGNLFKARVFPIFGHSEKRIKITYTQVLPRNGNRYRYSYALQSEMLKQHPLRKLAIDVKINSVVPLSSVTSPTHTTRIDTTAHSAHVEFSAQEYTPTRDFEVVVESDARQPEVVMIPHRRGDDGYFMMQLIPPDGNESAMPGEWQREVLPDGKPVELLILADTSGSIDAAGRQTQADFIASLFGSLTADDKINLACCDVDTHWIFKRPVPATEENVTKARDFLAARLSLGWTDLDKAFGSALKQCGPKTQVIYVGDGIATTGDADAVALGKRLKRLFGDKGGTCHAVTVSSTFEPVVLKTIASLGGGSLRQISGEKGPQTVAMELLGEMAKPVIRDLTVQFEGIRTARVYPRELPNLASGTQQILLGRYLPEGKDQTGEVSVTGMQGDRPVRLTARVSLKDAEAGNSFIPRLWARMHLDELLQQGTSSAVKDEIIALSEEYHIMTPYTSLLVLESDADRERFKVKRRFQMRDGEKFFPEGRDNVDYELVRQQMKRAGDWRLGLRRAVLRQLLALGRDARMLQAKAGGSRDYNGQILHKRSSDRRNRFAYDVGGMGGGFSPMGGPASTISAPMDSSRAWFANGDKKYDVGGDDFFGLEFDVTDGDAMSGEFAGAKMPKSEERLSEVFDEVSNIQFGARNEPLALQLERPLGDFLSARNALFAGDREGGLERSLERSPRSKFELAARPMSRGSYLSNDRYLGRRQAQSQQYTQWLNTLFPQLPPAPQPEVAPEKPWPAEARALAKSLLRTERLAKLDGGLRIERESRSFDVRWDNLTARSERLELVSPKAWLTRSGGHGSQTTVHFCDAQQRGVFSKAFGLGRLRESTPRDLSKPPLTQHGYTMSRLDHAYQKYSVELEPKGDGRTLLRLKPLKDQNVEIRFLIDTTRHVILSRENYHNDKLTSTTTFDQFVEAAGAWWAGRLETTDKDGRRTSLVTRKFQELAPDAYKHQIERELAPRDRVEFLHEPLVELADAKRALGQGKASFDDRLALILHFCGNQQWERVIEHLDEAERIGGNRPGMRWVRDAIFGHARRREELRGRIVGEAGEVAKPQAAEAYFLAEYLRGQASGILQANEMLALLDTLKPVYERQPEHLQAMKKWTGQRVKYLRKTGQADRAIELQSQLAADYPRDSGLQRQYAQALAGAGQYDDAYAWLDRVLADENAKWRTHEEDSLRSTYVQFLRNQGRYPDMAEYLADWVAHNPQTVTAYQQYLSALFHTNQIDKADTLIGQWIEEGLRAAKAESGELPPEVTHRLRAAVNQALGRGHNMRTNRLDEQWLDPLAETVLTLARHKTQSSVAEQIMRHGQFQKSDQCRGVRKQVLAVLTAEIETLTPQEVQRLVNWIWPNDPAVEARVWRRLAGVLKERWTAETDPDAKHQLASPLVRILSGKLTTEEHLGFLREQLQKGPKKYRTNHAAQLYNALLARPWSAEHEDEAFGLLEKLSEAEDAGERLLAQVRALYRLTDRMVQARNDALMAKVEHQEELTRAELSEKKRENLRAAREGFADRLQEAVRNNPQDIGQWISAERLYLETLLARDLARVEQECWELLGPEPPKSPAPDVTPTRKQQLDAVLRNRALITLANLAARKEAKAESIDRLLKYADQAIDQADAKDVTWKYFKYQLLIALDRPQDLQKDLQKWLRADDPLNQWRLSLAYLLAEQGKIDPAITLLEAVEADDELGPKDYRTLADWYMVVDRRDKHERALIAAFKMTREHQLHNWLYSQLRPWQRREGQLPAELDKNVLRVFAALFQKSGSPQNYLHRLREFYQATRDFRLLAALPEAVVGHTAAKVYPFLQGMGSVLGEVRDEATADSIVEHLAEVREKAKTTVDRRALDLLELLVERRSSEVINQPGPHAAKALAAMQRAFKREWTDGEPRLMADFLAGLGRITQEELAEEQLRELRVLHEEAEKGTVDRLHIGHRRANCLWSYARHAEAVDLLQAALDEYQRACDGILPKPANGALDSLISYLEQRGHHARGENLLFEQMKHPANQQQTYWLMQRLYRLYASAIRNDGDVSLGSGVELYRTVQRKLQDELDTLDHNHRHNLINRLCDVYRAAKDKKLAGYADDLRAFAFERLPKLLPRQTNNYQSIVSTVSKTLCDVAGVRDGLAFLIERIENEPKWFRYTHQDGWRQHCYRLGAWRKEVKDLGDLDARLLAIVAAELRWDLESRQQHHRTMYHRHRGYYWKEKEDDFRKVAEEVYAQRNKSGASVRYIADYLYHGLAHRDRAVEMLLIAHKQKLLDEGSQSQLVRYLHERKRHGESIAILQPLVETRPDNIQYRVWLMHAYFRTQRPNELLALLKVTDEYFHQKGRWSESAMAALAKSCLDNHLFEQSTAYYEELIPLHQRTQPNRGIGNGTLSRYYRYMSQAYAGSGDTVKAVDAACGAIVSWGPTHKNRRQALDALNQVLRNSPDLDAYVVELDKQCEETGQENPIVRKALGVVYREKEQYGKAVVQLQLAVEVQPGDTETHRELIACHDQQQDKEGALRQLLASLQLSRRDINLYKDLGKRFADLQRPGQSERAYTSIVEMLPVESESHTMLAEIRQEQGRWGNAIGHWQRVADIRTLEPTGLLKLAAAQIHQNQWDAAAETLRKLETKGWPSRFGDVTGQVHNLRQEIQRKRN